MGSFGEDLVSLVIEQASLAVGGDSNNFKYQKTMFRCQMYSFSFPTREPFPIALPGSGYSDLD